MTLAPHFQRGLEHLYIEDTWRAAQYVEDDPTRLVREIPRKTRPYVSPLRKQ